ncbi:MAG: hypothetical protein ABEJ83_03990 [Candidatus Nanohaloarchaea archaeon]
MSSAVEVEYEEVGSKVEVDKEDFENLLATIETLENEKVVEQLASSQADKNSGKVSKWSEVKEEIGV